MAQFVTVPCGLIIDLHVFHNHCHKQILYSCNLWINNCKMGSLTSRQNAGVEEVDITSNHAYKYPPRSGIEFIIMEDITLYSIYLFIFFLFFTKLVNTCEWRLRFYRSCLLIRELLLTGSYFGSHFIMGGERFDTPQPEAYLFGENADLNFLGSRPTPVWTSCNIQSFFIRFV